jgi:uncharacterized SAM-binding protein YcdF (DUF218 family)
MADALNWVFEAARFELITKALTLVLLVGGALALWEIIRYVRTLRIERDLARRLTIREVYGSSNDPRYAAWSSRGVPRQGMFGRAVRWTVQAVGVLSIVILVTAAAAMPFLGTWLESQDYLEKADYIVPLPGDDQRLLTAAELYKQGFAPRILLSHELPPPAGSPSTDTYESQLRVLEKEGVPRASTASLGSNQATIVDTAEALKTLVEGRRAKVIVVASGIQSLRTKVIFEDVVPRARFIVVSPADGGVERPWWNSQESALRTIAEATQLAHYWIGSSLRALQTELATLSRDPKSSQASTSNKPAESLGSRTDGRRQ